MRRLERQLDPKTFLRIHRSAIVNIDRIKGLTPWSHGEYVVTMQDDTRLHAGRVYSHQLDALIEVNGLTGD
jgi:two-component system LytT family response regulator